MATHEADTVATFDARDGAPRTDVVTVHLEPHVSHEAYAELRDKGPVARVSFAFQDHPDDDPQLSEFAQFLGREHLFVTRYDEVLSVLLDNRISSDPGTALTQAQREKLPPVPEELRPISRSIVTTDPPDHTRLRKLIQPSFSPRAMEAMRPRIQKIAEDLLDEAERKAAACGQAPPGRRMDLIEAFAYPLPVTVISDMLGIPLEDRAMVRGWTEVLLRTGRPGGGMEAESRAKVRKFVDYLRALFVAKRQKPADDMITQLLQAEEEGDKLDEEEVLSTVFILYLAGHVTTVNLIGNGVFALLCHPGELSKLKANPGGLARGVVEETLRYLGPVDFIARRIAKEDLAISGTHVPKGEPMMIGLASANRDPARFTNPDTYDISRAEADRHVAFGKGIHLCVGAPLARLEGQIAFETLFRRLPEMRLAIPAEEVRWNSSFLRGLAALPVLF